MLSLWLSAVLYTYIISYITSVTVIASLNLSTVGKCNFFLLISESSCSFRRFHRERSTFLMVTDYYINQWAAGTLSLEMQLAYTAHSLLISGSIFMSWNSTRVALHDSQLTRKSLSPPVPQPFNFKGILPKRLLSSAWQTAGSLPKGCTSVCELLCLYLVGMLCL